MANASFRADVDILNVEVNDNGDTIRVPLSDERFNKKLLDFANQLSDSANELANAEVSEEEVLQKDIEFHEKLRTEFDNLFGEGSYIKAFGDILAGGELVIEFVEFIMPYINESTQKRLKKLNKYNPNRVGSSI